MQALYLQTTYEFSTLEQALEASLSYENILSKEAYQVGVRGEISTTISKEKVRVHVTLWEEQICTNGLN